MFPGSKYIVHHLCSVSCLCTFLIVSSVDADPQRRGAFLKGLEFYVLPTLALTGFLIYTRTDLKEAARCPASSQPEVAVLKTHTCRCHHCHLPKLELCP